MNQNSYQKPVDRKRFALLVLACGAILGTLSGILVFAGSAEAAAEPDETAILLAESYENLMTSAINYEEDITALEEDLVDCVTSGNKAEGQVVELHIQANADDRELLTYENLLLLSKIITAESGSDWPDWAYMAIGEVVLNRVASPEFPNTISEVLYEINPIQYDSVFSDQWDNVRPTEAMVRLALRLLTGERVLNDPSIVFQSLYEQGSDTALVYYDNELGTATWFCRSENMELYES